ncbi:hypothetical protein [Amorphus orientalis]|uniref:Uncharacterized protein n=1 Tax=Amorphus orientalis TaxID=649198 RepID=A0AAE4AW70_9HYPH|nr:hypothetical protein [Amorphus orientalis]MDQ0317459.1 hypothetical protein [Amorphus orientalis]
MFRFPANAPDQAQSAVWKVATKTAASPIIVFCFTIFALSLCGAIFGEGFVRVVFSSICALIAIFGAGCIGYLLLRDPDRLHSEDHIFKKYMADKNLALDENNNDYKILNAAPVQNNSPEIQKGEML